MVWHSIAHLLKALSICLAGGVNKLADLVGVTLGARGKMLSWRESMVLRK